MTNRADWQPLRRFRDPSIPKLHNLRRAERAGLRVPPTWWINAKTSSDAGYPKSLGDGPIILRSGSPMEDTRETSNAGQLLSLIVTGCTDFADSLRQVVAALPNGAGVIFAQPLVQSEEAGVAFFDGFYYEQASAQGGNQDLTSGQARGEVRRGHLARGEAWSDWLRSLWAIFRNERRLDIEWARDANGYVLLQVRPALFAVARNETLSLANHKEILGDLPSPWIVSVLADAGTPALQFFERIDPAIADWHETYAVALAERAWMNFGFFFRLMDHWGLPRTWVTEGVGGEANSPDDSHFLPRRFARAIPRLLRLQTANLLAVHRANRALRELDAQIDSAQGLLDLYAANVAAMTLAIQTNFAINGILSGVSRLRKTLRVPGTARVVTQAMMEDYGAVATLPTRADRENAFDAWLTRYGHRGPLESDPARPRFSELRETLWADLEPKNPPPPSAHSSLQGTPPETGGEREAQATLGNSSFSTLHPPVSGGSRGTSGVGSAIFRPLFLIDERREWFRDALMHQWQRLRTRLLEEGARLTAQGRLEKADDVFLLRGVDLIKSGALRPLVAEARNRVDAARRLGLPLTTSRDDILAALTQAEAAPSPQSARRVFPGIPLGSQVVEGRVVKVDDLLTLLAQVQQGLAALGPDAILVVPTLEPSWAIVFGRVAGVIAEVGGELSHASILLREAGRPALVNCAGIYAQVQTGDRLRLDGPRRRAEVL